MIGINDCYSVQQGLKEVHTVVDVRCTLLSRSLLRTQQAADICLLYCTELVLNINKACFFSVYQSIECLQKHKTASGVEHLPNHEHLCHKLLQRIVIDDFKNVVYSVTLKIRQN